mmetsp:Transcript_42421/g.92432  ORF Transcript_42421/g.92432 Transcript_42421/m.92432 type:complete len:209 (+) Transcript_42421:1198-1824(+)
MQVLLRKVAREELQRSCDLRASVHSLFRQPDVLRQVAARVAGSVCILASNEATQEVCEGLRSTPCSRRHCQRCIAVTPALVAQSIHVSRRQRAPTEAGPDGRAEQGVLLLRAVVAFSWPSVLVASMVAQERVPLCQSRQQKGRRRQEWTSPAKLELERVSHRHRSAPSLLRAPMPEVPVHDHTCPSSWEGDLLLDQRRAGRSPRPRGT